LTRELKPSPSPEFPKAPFGGPWRYGNVPPELE